jgi:RNA polymerase sigma factor (sigma-70 family)
MNKPQYALPPGSNNGTGTGSSAAASAVEPAINVDPEINNDAVPRLERRISPDFSSMDIKNISLRKLLEYCLLKEEDEDAWREFDQRVRPTIRGVVARRLRSCRVSKTNELVGEVTHDTFVKLFNHDRRALRKDWVDDDSIFKFVKVVGQSAAVDWLRKNKILKDPDELDDSYDLRSRPAPNPAEEEILREQVDRCLQTLASEPNYKRDRAIFWLFYRYGYRDSEIAALVKLPPKTVQNILQKYVRKVRLKLHKDKGKGAPEE